VMESKVRRIFREALAMHYIDGLEVGPQVDSWLKSHGGWFPDPQELYGDGSPMDQPIDEGEDVASKDPSRALDDAKELMPKLIANLAREMESFPEDANMKFLADTASSWMTESGDDGAGLASSSLTEANVEAHEFAEETVESFKKRRVEMVGQGVARE